MGSVYLRQVAWCNKKQNSLIGDIIFNGLLTRVGVT